MSARPLPSSRLNALIRTISEKGEMQRKVATILYDLRVHGLALTWRPQCTPVQPIVLRRYLSADSNHKEPSSVPSSSSKLLECWKCGKTVPRNELFCKADSCGVVQAVQPENLDFFEAFGLPVIYELDEKSLDISFKQLQMKLHPDRFAAFSNQTKDSSTQSSAAINYAFQTLKSPLHRAEYMVPCKLEYSFFQL